MSAPYRLVVPRALARLEGAILARRDAGPVEAWALEPARARRAVAARLAAARGAPVRIHAAYKPLLGAFLERPELAGATDVEVLYPVLAGVFPERFLLECHPLDALLAGPPPRFRARVLDAGTDAAASAADGAPALGYEIRFRDGGGARRELRVPVPVRWRRDARGAHSLVPSPWHRGPSPGDLERVLDAALGRVDALGPPGEAPERLEMRLEGPFEDEPLGVDEECASLAEAMHEELLFGAMERLRASRAGASGPRPIQLAPLVRAVERDDWALEIRTVPAPRAAPDGVLPDMARDASDDASAPGPTRAALPALDDRRSWLGAEEVADRLEDLGGEAFGARTRLGGIAPARHVRPRAGTTRGASVVLSAGRHANETSGTVGALRAARELAAGGEVELAVAPLLNPDGHALFAECCAASPRHMHHAGRYSAEGRDPADDPASAASRTLAEARARTGAALHVDCHGYPAHEWTRPLAGRLPRGFEAWSIPRGFFLICRHAPGLRAVADRIVDAAAAALGALPALAALNAEQLARRARYLPRERLELRSGVAVTVAEARGAPFPIALVTEAPDETVHGERFALLHEAHRRAARAAVAELLAIARGAGRAGSA